jgi:predicted ATPase
MAEIGSEPVLKSFRILGLHGYKDVELRFDGPVRIVIAENGMGKTTILAALHAFLIGNLGKLRKLQFVSLECDLTTSTETLTLHREDLPDFSDQPAQEKLRELADFSVSDVGDLERIILDVNLETPRDMVQHHVLGSIYYNSPYSMEDVFEQICEIKNALQQSRSEELKTLLSKITACMKQFDILYLPTYRRIEIPLPYPIKRAALRQRRHPSGRFAYRSEGRFGDYDIQFGLRDVGERLTQLFDEIQRQTNFGYRSISANIIDELLAGLLPDSPAVSADLPDIDALARFFSRIETTEAPDQRLRALRELYESGRINDRENTTLRYFLTKLSTVVDQTKEREADIQAFVDKANGYLQQSSDEKCLQYDPNEMKVIVQNQWTQKEVDLDGLSSGEKQVISLLASLYLYPRRKIVLIDEPELSLSIDWQKRLLPDVLEAPFCSQIFAITHSPFIFDNELDPYAGPLKIERRKIS